MDDPEMPELAEDVDSDDDSEDGGSKHGSGDEGNTLQDFIERLYQDFPFLRTESHPHTDSRPTENQPEGFTDTTGGPGSQKNSPSALKKGPWTCRSRAQYICSHTARRHANNAKFLHEQAIYNSWAASSCQATVSLSRGLHDLGRVDGPCLVVRLLHLVSTVRMTDFCIQTFCIPLLIKKDIFIILRI
jgi:hypothetical protein